MKRYALCLIPALALLSCAEKEILETEAETYLFEATREEFGGPWSTGSRQPHMVVIQCEPDG